MPSRPRIFRTSHCLPNSFYVHWEPPSVLNGQLVRYLLMWYVENYESTTNRTRYIAGHLTDPMMAYITELSEYLLLPSFLSSFSHNIIGQISLCGACLHMKQKTQVRSLNGWHDSHTCWVCSLFLSFSLFFSAFLVMNLMMAFI